jgi:hypothetical protein
MNEPVARNPERNLTMSRNDLINRLVARKMTESRPAKALCICLGHSPAKQLCYAGPAQKLCYAGTEQPASTGSK